MRVPYAFESFASAYGSAYGVHVLLSLPAIVHAAVFTLPLTPSRPAHSSLLRILLPPSGILAYNEYGSLAFMKALSWLMGVIISILIVASRKHYTVDVVIAWYTVPLVFYTMYRRWTTRRPMSDFIGGSALSAFDDVDGGELELEEVRRDSSGAVEVRDLPKQPEGESAAAWPIFPRLAPQSAPPQCGMDAICRKIEWAVAIAGSD